MSDLIERLRFDAARCEMQFSKGVAGNIEEAAAEIERLRAALTEIANDGTRVLVSSPMIARAALDHHRASSLVDKAKETKR